jgi:PAS domain S-box-containing protein
MNTFLRRFSVATAFALLVFVLVGNAILTSRRVSVQEADEEWVIHGRQVLSELEQTESLLFEAQSGQRGFLFTDEDTYLAPYNRAVAQIDGHLQALSELTRDDPTQQANVAELRTLAHQKLDGLKQTVAFANAGHFNQAIILTDQGQVVMDQIHRVITAMVRQETALEAVRSANYRQSIRMTNISIVLAAVVGVLGLIVLAYFILRERALRDRYTREIGEREQWLRVTLSSIGDGVIATDRNGVVTFFNPVAEVLTGVSSAQARGKDLLTVFPIVNELNGQPAENPARTVLERGRTVKLANHTVIKHAEGRLIPIEDSAAPILDDRKQLIGVVLVFRDVTAARKSEEMLRKSEKLAAAARLSATVAHQINNPLEAVINLIFLARAEPGTPQAAGERLILAEQEIERVAHLTRQTLGFYRESLAPERIEIEALLESTLRLYSNQLQANRIAVRRTFGKCPPVQGVAGELRQVFSNVIANAIDAAGHSGEIVVSCSFAPIGDDGVVEVVIADSGTGVAPEHLERIFEPFFTTKKDVGTGLGLWVTKEIMERHGGIIRVCPANGCEGFQGAAFTLQLPCAPLATLDGSLRQPN